MATTKRLTPTGVNMSIPEFTEKPDQRVNSTALDQLGDAVNTINDKIIFETITSGDFNNYVATGSEVKHYCGTNVNSFTNAPSNLSNYNFTLDVFPIGTGSTYTKQILHFYGTTPATYERQQYYSGGRQWTAWQQLVLKSEIDSVEGGVPVRRVGVIANNGTVSFRVSNSFSSNADFAIVCLNISGSATVGYAILALGKGTNKYKDLIGAMDTNAYTCSYSNGTWTITNKCGSDMYYTALITRIG